MRIVASIDFRALGAGGTGRCATSACSALAPAVRSGFAPAAGSILAASTAAGATASCGASAGVACGAGSVTLEARGSASASDAPWEPNSGFDPTSASDPPASRRASSRSSAACFMSVGSIPDADSSPPRDLGNIGAGGSDSGLGGDAGGAPDWEAGRGGTDERPGAPTVAPTPIIVGFRAATAIARP